MDQNQLEKARAYARKQLTAGYSVKTICEVLRKANYDSQIIKTIDNEFSKKSKAPIWITIIVILAVIPVFFIIFSDLCDSKQCFAERAADGKTATYREVLFGSEIEYTYKDNQITTKFISFSADEPIIVVELLSNKEMVCPYRGIESIDLFSGMEFCQGPLRDALFELENVI